MSDVQPGLNTSQSQGDVKRVVPVHERCSVCSSKMKFGCLNLMCTSCCQQRALPCDMHKGKTLEHYYDVLHHPSVCNGPLYVAIPLLLDHYRIQSVKGILCGKVTSDDN